MDKSFNFGATIVTTLLLMLFWGIIVIIILLIRKGINKMQNKFAENNPIEPEIDKNVRQRLEEVGKNRYYGEEKTPEKLVFTCPICQSDIRTSYSARGDVVVCKRCKEKIIIPENAQIIK